MKLYKIIIILLFSFGFIFAQTGSFDHSLFDELLKNNVDDKGLINYEAFIKNKNFDKYLVLLQTANLESLSLKERFAFLINAYNALVIKNVINHWPINSPMDVDGFFDKKKFNLAGSEVTLNEIEYEHVFKIDPVLCHFGLVCAGKSCPKLLPEAYNGENIYEKLELNARVFFNDPKRNRLDKETNTLHISEIFKWFKDIFVEKFGSVKLAVVNFIKENDSKFIKENEIIIKYIPYDWNLNTQ